MTTRTRKSPRQRAEEALGVAERLVKKLAGKVEKAKADLATLEAEHAAAQTRLEYVKSDPALTDQTLTEGADDPEGTK